MAKSSVVNPLCYVLDRQYNRNYTFRKKLFRDRFANARNLYRKDLLGHYGCVNAIEFSDEGELIVSGGDDRRVLLWSVPQVLHAPAEPIAMDTGHSSNIFCLGFDGTNTRIFSGGNDDQLLIHDINTGRLIVRFPHRKPVYGLSVHPHNDNLIATASDDGRILVYDVREGINTEPWCLAKLKTAFHSVMFNPMNSRLVCTANSDDGVALYDCRKPRERLMRFDQKAGSTNAIHCCFNSTGTRILALRRRLPPVLYSPEREEALCQFYHPQYYNSCTMKTCCFAGEDDEYVVSGSDDFNLYFWQVPEEDVQWGSTHLIVEGHRSIVNQVRYNKQNNLLASSGVEKMVKLWSTLPIGTWKGSLLDDHNEPDRPVYTHAEYLYLVGAVGERISHDYSDRSTQEDCKMMAFFDSLIQREVTGWKLINEHSDFSETDSETEIETFKELCDLMYSNTREDLDDFVKKQQTRKVTQLIALRRNCLAKMAHANSLLYSSSGPYKFRSKKRKQKSSKSKFNGWPKKIGKMYPLSRDTKTHNFVPEKPRYSRYSTRQGLRNAYDILTQAIDVPSTSTGIRGSNDVIYHVLEQDSDEDIPGINYEPPEPNLDEEEAEDEDLLNVIPTDLNGSNDMYASSLEMNEMLHNVTNNELLNLASNSRQTRNEADPTVRVNGWTHSTPYYHNNNANNNNNRFENIHADENTDSDSDYECDYVTPTKAKRIAGVPDSGFGSSSYSRSNAYLANNQNYTNDSDTEEENRHEKFRKRAKRAQMNIRKHIRRDSDSN